MKKVRIIKSSKNPNPKINQHTKHLEENSEEVAKKSLFQLSQTNFYTQTYAPLHQPDRDLQINEDDEEKTEKVLKKSCTNARYQKYKEKTQDMNMSNKGQLLKQFKKLMQGFVNLSKSRKTMIGSERNYQSGDKWVSITMRSPIIPNSYIVSGNNQNRSFNSTPPVSQYIIRQQRNASKLKRSMSKTEQTPKKQQPRNMKIQLSFTQSRSPTKQSEQSILQTKKPYSIRNQIYFKNTKKLQKQLL